MTVHHIGYLVKNMEKAIRKFQTLGYVQTSDVTYDAIRRIDIVFLEKDGYTVELVSTNDPESVVYNLYARYKNAPYHICYQTDDLGQSLEELSQAGFTQIAPPCAAPAIGSKRVVFLMNSAIGMIELVEA